MCIRVFAYQRVTRLDAYIDGHQNAAVLPTGRLTMSEARSTYADTSGLFYRLRAASALLGVTDNTLRGYADTSGIKVLRANEIDGTSAVAARVFDVETLFKIAQWRRSQGYIKAPATSNGGPVVVTVDVVKGGTGKTTTAVETALHLQLMGLRVLCIDLDIQANMTQAMGYESDLDAKEMETYGLTHEALITETFVHVMKPFLEAKRSDRPVAGQPLDNLIKKPFGPYGPHLIGADTYLGDLEMAIISSFGARELTMRELFEASVRGEIPGFDISGYDVVLFDCPPSVSLTSSNALAVADIAIAPVRMDSFAVKGLTHLMREIKGLEKQYRVRPELIILPTHYAPKLARIGRMQSRLHQYKELLAPLAISASEEYPKSLENYLPLALQRPTSVPAREYQTFAGFLHDKILAHAAVKASRQ